MISKPDWNNIFEYKPNGSLIWRNGPPTHRRINKIAGGTDKKYMRVKVWGKSYFVHRIIWEMHNGPIPNGKQIDHIDQNQLNNKIENLRLVDPVGNAQNRGKRKDNKSGHVGVHWHKTKQLWCAYVSVDKKLKHLGYFTNKTDAVNARKQAVVNFNYLCPKNI